jgi:hypothetical protein
MAEATLRMAGVNNCSGSGRFMDSSALGHGATTSVSLKVFNEWINHP